uniref:Carboxypeptidase-like regulatory domain-containing protein n=1 Tax=Roseihalotalea indica TaxID=2867963 RepID=A0AA49JF63_9BACT|nr:carboxypeptidase-like regulatory domain-containing protein [Tunicatimonas sp. TK19036]
MGKICFFIASFCLLVFPSIAQIDTVATKLPPLTVSGIVISSDSILSMPFTSIFVNQLPKGTITDRSGFFTLNIYPADTLTFSAVGYKTAQFVIPEKLLGNQYSLVQAMVRDTIILEEVTIYSLPTTSEFMESFSDQPAGFEKRMEQMSSELQSVLEEDIILSKYQPVDINDGITRMYSAHWGLVPPNNFLNPMRWTQFVQDLRKKRKRAQEK